MWTAYLFSVDKQWTVNVDKCKTSLIGVIFLNKNTENMYKKIEYKKLSTFSVDKVDNRG